MLVNDILELNVRKDPKKDAVVFGDTTTSFAELLDRTRRLGNALLTVAGPGDRIALLARNIPEYIDAYYGVPSARLTLLLLNYRLSINELAWIVHDAAARVMIVQDDYLDAVLAARDKFAAVEQLIVIGDGDLPPGVLRYRDLVDAASTTPLPAPADDDVAWQVYTSGTTGHPKGAMVSQRNIMSNTYATALTIGGSTTPRHLVCFPLCHISGLNVFMNHLLGGCEVVTQAFEAGEFLRLIEQQRITTTSLAPAMVRMVLDHPDFATRDRSSLVALVTGGSGWDVDVLRRSLVAFGPILSSGYGMTETAMTLVIPSDLYVRASRGETHLMTAAGVQTPLAAARVVDDAGKEVGPNVVGEIVVSSESVFLGYWGNPDATKAAFRDGWFHTGDMARRDEEGIFFIVDRRQDMILSGGENVYSLEVENALQRNPNVAEAAVIGTPDPKWGELVTAIVVLREGCSPSADDIITACREHIAAYKAPRKIVFADALPKNTAGKILKKDLRGPYWEGQAFR